jgi:hypothetical protein
MKNPLPLFGPRLIGRIRRIGQIRLICGGPTRNRTHSNSLDVIYSDGEEGCCQSTREMPALRYNDFSIRNTEKPISRNEATTQKQDLRFYVASSRRRVRPVLFLVLQKRKVEEKE